MTAMMNVAKIHRKAAAFLIATRFGRRPIVVPLP